MIWDKWQQDIIEHQGSVTLRSGRQVGKSTVIGKRCANLMLKHPNTNSLIIAPAIRQSSELFIKTMGWLTEEHIKLIDAAGGYKDDPEVSARGNIVLRRVYEREHGLFAETPTKSMAKLKNGSILYSLPAGKTGVFLRSYTIHFLYIDEAAYVPEAVYNAIKPMLAVTMKQGLGWECLISTPAGKGGFFYDSQHNEDYLIVYVNSEDCERVSRKLLRSERARLTKVSYAQEWQGKWVDEFQQYFPTKLIKACMKKGNFIRWNYKEHFNKMLGYYEGVDYAGPGKDDNAFVTGEMQDNDDLRIVMVEESDEPNTVKTNKKIVAKDVDFNFRKLFVDSGGFGCGPSDELTEKLGRKVVGLNNAKKSIDKDTERTNKILKEDLYSNAKVLMERGKILMIDSLPLLNSLKSMTFEYTEDRRIKISGKNSHIAEAFVRVCWAVKEKGLNIYVC